MQSSEHCASYYAATLNGKDQYPELTAAVDADVCVIGAGFTGVNTALELAERGYNVALVEGNRVGWGASGRNGGQLIGGFSGAGKIAGSVGGEADDLIWQMRWAGNEIVKRRIEKHQISCDLKMGYIDVATRPRHLRDFEEEDRELSEHQFPFAHRVVPRDELPEIIGTDVYHGGLINMANGHLHPLNLCHGEAKAAQQAGVRIFEMSPVRSIEHGTKPVVKTDKGEVRADKVIIAGGAYHLLEHSKIGGVVFPAGSYIIATEPLGEQRAREILPQDYAVCGANHVLDYYRLSGDNRLLFGGRCNYSGRDPKSVKASILPRMLAIYPQLSDARVEYEWGGKIGIVINRVPMIGRLNQNCYFAFGYSGHGVNFSHLVGEIMAETVDGTMTRFDLFDRMGHLRIPGGRWFGNQLVALGMIYYRLRDLL